MGHHGGYQDPVKSSPVQLLTLSPFYLLTFCEPCRSAAHSLKHMPARGPGGARKPILTLNPRLIFTLPSYQQGAKGSHLRLIVSL